MFPPAPRKLRALRLSPPFVAQSDDMDCGAACLAMISAHHENPLPVHFWREKMTADPRGVSLFDIAEAGDKAGFVCHGFRLRTFQDIEPAMFPLIALRAYHFVVVYAADRKGILFGDPGVGIRRVSWEDFQPGFDGHVLILKPTAAFYGLKAQASPYGHFFALLDGLRFELGLVFAISVVMSALTMVPAFLFQFIIDQVLARRDYQLLWASVLAGMALTLLIGVIEWMRGYYLAFLSSRFDFAAASAFVHKLMSLPYEFFTRRHVGDFSRRLAEMERVREFLISDIIQQVLALANLVIYGAVLVHYSPRIALVVFVSAPALVVLAMLFTNPLIRKYNEVFSARAEEESLFTSQIKGMATIKTLGAEIAARWRFEEATVRTLRARYHYQIAGSTFGGLSGVVRQFLSIGIMALAAAQAIEGRMTAGQVMSVSILAGNVIGPFSALAGMWPMLQEMRTVMDRLNDVFLAKSESAASAAAAPAPARLRGQIEFRDVWFRYGGESSDWILKGVSFKVEPGQSVALVGASGAGKSTVALLLARLFEPTKGSILIDGRDYLEYDRRWVRQQVGLLLQETDLFHGTIRDNIAYGNPQPDLQRLERAVALADAKTFIAQKGSGYDYLITHGGLGLSVGQKQRLALARILYTDPSILVLDEATSFLDSTSERAVIKALKATTRDRTVLSIAHRLSTVKMSDRILVLDDGRIVESGDHAALLAEGGLYAGFFGEQA